MRVSNRLPTVWVRGLVLVVSLSTSFIPTFSALTQVQVLASIELEMPRVLRIETTRGRNVTIGTPTDIAVLRSRSEFVIVDWDNDRLLRIDENFRLIERIGRFGQGPRQFDSPRIVQTTNQLGLVVYDAGNRRFQWLDSDLKFMQQFRPSLGIRDFIPNGQNQILIVPTRNPQIRRPEILLIEVASGVVVDSFASGATGPYDEPHADDLLYSGNVVTLSDGRIAYIYRHTPDIQLLTPYLDSAGAYNIDIDECHNYLQLFESIYGTPEGITDVGTRRYPVITRDAVALTGNRVLINFGDYSTRNSFIFYVFSFQTDSITAVRLESPVPLYLQEAIAKYALGKTEIVQPLIVPSLKRFDIIGDTIVGIEVRTNVFLSWDFPKALNLDLQR